MQVAYSNTQSLARKLLSTYWTTTCARSKDLDVFVYVIRFLRKCLLYFIGSEFCQSY